MRSISGVFLSANKPAMPSPTNAGVFGITRTMDFAVGMSSANRAVEIPAAIEMINLSEKSTALNDGLLKCLVFLFAGLRGRCFLLCFFSQQPLLYVFQQHAL